MRSTPIRWSLTLCAFLLALAHAPVRGAEAEGRLHPVISRGTGYAEVAGQRVPLPWSRTSAGPLVALQPLVPLFGGELEIGPLRQSHTLRVQEIEAVLGPDSGSMVLDHRIVPIAPAPAVGDGGLQVPLEVLERTWGDALGWEIAWDGVTGTLTARQRPSRELELAVEALHVQGVTTLVLRFDQTPHYRIESGAARLVVDLGRDVIRLAERRPLPDGSLVRRVDIGEHRIVLGLAVRTEVTDYVLDRPFRLVFDVHRAARAAFPEELPVRPPRELPGVKTIVIDPGHGGRETGAVGPTGLLEKDLSLMIARSVRQRLQERLGVRVVLTRDEDVELPLESRTALANQYKADLFLSIHLNSSPGFRAQGAETYFLSLEASDEVAAEVAARENQPAGRGIVEAEQGLQLMLWDLAQSHHLAESQRLATLIQGELNRTLGLRDRGVKQAPFVVLRGAAMPAVLVELGFLNDPEQEQRLADTAYRGELVEALVRAVTRFKAQVEDRGGNAAEAVP